MDLFAEEQSKFKIIKFVTFWLLLIGGCLALLFIYQYEIRRPSAKQEITIDIAGKVNVCRPDPIIDRKLYERF